MYLDSQIRSPLLAAIHDGTPKTMPNSRLQTLAGTLGNVLEWYDFALFGFFSDIIAELFFSPSNAADGANENLVRSFAVYGGAFIMRPVGGAVIGYLGDKYGRKYALVTSLFLMAVPTFAMGCLPTYEQIGWWSTLLLVLCRLLQGMSVGGQLPASLIYTVETRPKERWGLFGSFVMMAANIGTLLGNLVGALLRTVLTYEQLLAWGWRIPFRSGILISFVAIYLRLNGHEHHPNEGQYNQEGREVAGQQMPKHPLREAIRRENITALISATLTPMLWGAGYYVSFVWMAIYMAELIDEPLKNAFWINCISLIVGVIAPVPLAGWLSDKCGRVKTMVVGALGLGGLGPVLLYVISRGNALSACLCQISIGWFLSLFGGPLGAWLGERFPPKVRLTSVSLGYDIAHSTASGFSPMIATILAQKVNPTAPGIIYTFFAFVALIGLMITTQIHNDETAHSVTRDETASTVNNPENIEPRDIKAGMTNEEPAVNPIV